MAIIEYDTQEEMDAEFDRIEDLRRKHEELKDEVNVKEIELSWAEQELEHAKRVLEAFEYDYQEELFQ